MNILSLDLGTTTGWAISMPDKIQSGVVSLKGYHFDSPDSKYTKFRRFLGELKHRYGPIDHITYEAVRRHAGTIAGQTYGGFCAALQMFGDHHRIPYEGVPVATIKKFATGHGNASKLDMINAMQNKGHTPKDDNEADALALLYYTLKTNAETSHDCH